MARLIDVYPYRISEEKIEFLLLKRSEKVQYSGQWRMVAGKVQEGEKAWEAGLRELKEETSASPIYYWALPSVNSFYNPPEDQIEHIPAFAAELEVSANITLNKEHNSHKWINIDEVADHIKWPEQKRLMSLGYSILSNNKVLEEWVISF